MAKSKQMLVFGSDGFFGGSNPPSKPCMLEMFACMQLKLPIVALLEVEDKHHPLTRDDLWGQVKALDEPIVDGDGKVLFSSMYDKWGLLEEMDAKWGIGAPPIAQKLYDAVFEYEAIEWNRAHSLVSIL